MMKMEVAVNDVWATDGVLSLFPSLYWGGGGGGGGSYSWHCSVDHVVPGIETMSPASKACVPVNEFSGPAVN